jgi:ribonuclease VapC
MVIDTSALVAILLDEPERRGFTEKIEADPRRLMSAASLVETALVIETRLGEAGGRELDLLLFRAEIEVIPVDRDQAEIARRAFRHYGRGRHQASLNFGDCFAYALVMTTGEPLLFKGNDFSRTDVVAA